VTVDNASLAAHCKLMLTTTIQVALGGAIGAALRFLTGVGILRFVGSSFPVAILGINVLGSLLMGMFVVFAAHRGLTQLNPFVLTGLLGGFTTFSAFSLEAVSLFERGVFGLAVLYVSLSVVLSIGGLVLGLIIARGIWA